jgi:hypothetical protein
MCIGRTTTVAALAVAAFVLCGAAPAPLPPPAEPVFQRPSPEEALRFLKSLPPVWRNTRDYDPKAPSKKILVYQWKDFTVEDMKTLKLCHPGGHVEEPGKPGSFSKGHLKIRPADWRYFTAFEQLEEFKMVHDIDGATDECLFYLGQLPQTMHTIKFEMSQATGEGVRYLQNLKDLKSLSLNFSRTITDVALVHAAGIESLEYLDVGACPLIQGSGVAALARLKNLKVLRIGSCSLSDASLAYFVHLPVEELDLSFVEQGWIIQYRGGGHCQFTVTAPGLARLLNTPGSLPNLKRLILRDTQISQEDKQRLAMLRPGLEVR